MAAAVIYPNVAAMYEMNLIAADLANCKVKLFQNDITLSPSTVKGDLTEATFSGYAAATVAALLPSYIDPAGGASAQIATQQFDHSGGATANTVYGAWVETAGGDLILAMTFENGIPMAALGDSIPLDVKFNFGNG